MNRKTASSIVFLSILISLLLWQTANAQFYFGRNKIQYDSFRWQVYHSAHFDIYYYPEEEEIAKAAAHFAEEAFREFEIKFNHTIRRKIPLIIYSNHVHFQQTNVLPYLIPEGVGGFFEFIKKRVVLPYTGTMHDFRHVVRHELVHVFMHHKIYEVADDIGAWETPNFPLWFVEGLAEWWSTGWDSQAELIIRDAALHDYLFALNSYELMAAGFLLYKEGQSFLRFFEREYGIDRLRAIMEEFCLYDKFDEVFEGIAHKKFEDLEAEWKISVKRECAAALQQEEVIEPGECQLTRFGPNASPRIYKDSSGKDHLIYLSGEQGYIDIRQKTPGKKRPKTVVQGGRTADRESLHFLQSEIAIHPDGRLAYVTKSGRQDVIRIVEIENRKELQSLHHPDLISIHSPKWSADGRKIVFSAQDFNGRSDLYLWDLENAHAKRLTDDIYADLAPCCSPCGEWIVFSSDRNREAVDGGLDLFLLRLSDSQVYRLTQDAAANNHPLWLENEPDKIFFLSDRSGTQNVYALDLPNDEHPEEPQITIHQKTNYHTGLQDLHLQNGDSLLSSVFMRYNFQIHQLPIQSSQLIDQTDFKTLQQADSSWQIPDLKISMQQKTRPYRLQYSLDFAQTNVVQDPIFGFLGGAQLGISDLLGNRYYHFLLANTAQTTSEILDRFNFAVTMVDLTRRSNRAIGAFHFANDYWDPYQGFYFERAIGVRGALNYPIDTYRRLEFSLSLWNSLKDFYFEEIEEAWLISNYFSFVHDNSIWTATGPIDGWSLRLMVGPTFDFLRSRLHNYTVLGDFRYYLRLHRKLTFAQRSMVWFNDGVDIRRFYIGGSWGMRGYRINQIYGRKYVMFNQELRFPFARSLLLQSHKTSVGLIPLRGAIFFDVGNAWDYDFPGMIGSFGIGLRGLFLGGIVLRLDVGKRTDFTTIDKDTFVQFFFGWDY